MENKSEKNNRLIGLMGGIFMTFGITYFDFDNLLIYDNIKPLIMMIIGLITIIYILNLMRVKGNK